MQETIKYAVFKTKWGYFGLVGNEYGLLRTHLPLPEPERIKSSFLANWDRAQYEQSLFKSVQEQIAAYFEGTKANFTRDIPAILDGLSPFTRKVLTTCRNIRFGETISYSGLAKRSGNASAARAVGRALAKNPLPLIIPCHRVIRNNGKIGGFSAEGGVTLKKRMLELERQSLGL